MYNYVNTTPRAAATLTRLIPLVTTIDVSDGSCRKGAGNPRVKRANVYLEGATTSVNTGVFTVNTGVSMISS